MKLDSLPNENPSLSPATKADYKPLLKHNEPASKNGIASSNRAGTPASKARPNHLLSRGAFLGSKFLLPLSVAAVFLVAWDVGVRISGSDLFPRPIDVLRGLLELIRKGLLLKYIVASLFRVTWGFLLAVGVGVPLGLILGWYARAFQALNPMIQIF